MHCRQCGASLVPGSQFCQSCGRRLDAPAKSTSPISKTGIGCLILLGGFVFLLILVSMIGGSGSHTTSPSPNSEPNQQTAAAPQPDQIPIAQHVSELKKVVAKHPLEAADASAIRQHVAQLRLKKVESQRPIAQLIDKAENRARWVEMRGSLDIEAEAACRVATKERLKAPDEVEWVDTRAGYDPKTDWVYNVEMVANAMNSFGAKLRSRFYCSALCSDKTTEIGTRCVAFRVREGD
jgi:hypothetical protein